jgi:hypothetical protein
MDKRLRQEPVGEPGVAREERSVEVRPDRTADAAAFEAALAVVPETRDDAAEGLSAWIEHRAPGVVLEAGQEPALAGLELALEEHVADHPALAGHRLVREEADARQYLAVTPAVGAAEQLVAAAHGEDHRAACGRLLQGLALLDQIGRHQRLLAVLAAAHVEEVVLARRDRVAEVDRPVLEADPAPGRASLQDGDVAAVRVDVEVVGVQVADDDLQALHAAAPSQ